MNKHTKPEDSIRVASWPLVAECSRKVSPGGGNVPAEVQAAKPGEQHRQWEELVPRFQRWEGALFT